MTEPLVLTPYSTREAASLKTAAGIAGRSEATLKRWCERYHIGRSVVGNWQVSRVALAMLLDGDELALRAYHAGDRTSPAVAPYFAALDHVAARRAG